ncbi:hypothetical protein [Aquimarina sp. 2201CG5-10]|uniref:hypothetical protein n=1 Tax=Aquimarina callyspongiae TaxID=3098150 RepID=UPI002AB40E39|nr:hypothetical protein [Aquimarina sp. 2201CG5-10]MDY8136711.1 hypothetical protein [Aquimarina sp. 2201CG5-10]
MKILVFILIFLTISCQNKDLPSNYSFHLDSSKIYLIFRGTNTKAGIVSKNFNILNKKISHIGLGVYEIDRWNIYHVVNTDNADSDLVIDNFESFSSVNDGVVDYMAIYELIDVKSVERNNLLDQLKNMKTKKIKFDNSFSINNGDNLLYCSEFVVRMLSEIKESKFKYIPRTVELNSFQTAYIGKETLTYYPVDIFLEDIDELKLIKEFNLN